MQQLTPTQLLQARAQIGRLAAGASCLQASCLLVPAKTPKSALELAPCLCGVPNDARLCGCKRDCLHSAEQVVHDSHAMPQLAGPGAGRWSGRSCRPQSRRWA